MAMIRGGKISTTVWLSVATLAAYGACLALNWPGHFSPDGLWQLGQGRSGVYNSWHPSIMAWLLGLAAKVSPDAGPFFAVDAALFFLSLLGFALARGPPRQLALFALSTAALSPLAVIYQGAVLKDVLFADLSVAGFACLAWSDRLAGHRALVSLVIAKAFGLFALATLARQTGFVTPLCGAAALVAILRGRGVGWRGAVGGGLGALIATGALVAAGSLALASHGDGRPENHHQMQRLQAWDVAGALHFDPHLSLPATRASAPELEAYLRLDAAPLWRAATSDNIANPPAFEPLMTPRAEGVGKDWIGLILRRPDLYLAVRSRVFLATLATPAADACPMVIIGVDQSDMQVLEMARLKPRYSPRDAFDEGYASAFYRTPIFSHLAWGVLLIVAMALAIRDVHRGACNADLIVVIFMGAAALLYVAGYFVISDACDYRYLYFIDVAAMAMLVHRAALP